MLISNMQKDEPLEQMALIIQQYEDINRPARNDLTPLMCAITMGSFDKVKFILENGGNVFQEDRMQRNAFHLACFKGEIDKMEIVLEYAKQCLFHEHRLQLEQMDETG